MEKSHHAAKAASQTHGQHGGTKDHTSIIVQQYKFWYRNIQHRYDAKLQKKIRAAERRLPDPAIITASSRQRDAWYASNAATAAGAWWDSCIREGSRYVQRTDESQEGGGSEVRSASFDNMGSETEDQGDRASQGGNVT
jgi:hypothetical protein